MPGTATAGHANTSPAAHQITVEHSFETAHRLPHLDGKCTSLHGHSWRVAVSVIASSLSEQATVVEFGALKAGVRQWIDTHLDHGTMLGVDDQLVEPLVAAGCKVFRFGNDRAATAGDAEAFAADLMWPTVEAVAMLVRRMSQVVLAALPYADAARVGRVAVHETYVNSATYGPVDAL
jgi:6-pyruvoyltetrahydropterin/6-carboxytetrahydropterin synthase